MIEPKPMSPERRAEIEADIAQLSTEGPMWTVMVSELRDLLADSAYWRQQVQRLTKALSFIRTHVDKNTYQHFVSFTNDAPDVKQWRMEIDRLLTLLTDWLKAQEGR